MILENKVSLKGEYKFKAVRKDGSVREETDWIPNLITDAGLNMIGLGTASWNSTAYVGEGNTPPANSDTALQTYHQSAAIDFGATPSTTTTTGSPDYIQKLTLVYTFPVQTVNKNYAEVGVGPTNTNLFSRALIVDSGGSPTTFTVLTGEQLQVTYRLWFYPQVVDAVSVVNISGTNYTITSRGHGLGTSLSTASMVGAWQWTTTNPGSTRIATAFNGSLGSLTTDPGGSFELLNIASVGSYTTGSFTRSVTYSASVSQANLSGGITVITGPMYLAGGAVPCPLQHGFSPALPKDNTKTLSITITHTWARH